MPFSDPEGQRLELVAPAEGEEQPPGGTPWTRSPIPAAYQIRGLHGVRLLSAREDATLHVLTETMGFRETGQYTLPPTEDGAEARLVRVYQVGKGGPGTEVHLEERATRRAWVASASAAFTMWRFARRPTRHTSPGAGGSTRRDFR